jgi:hypothetical protein
MFYHVIHLYANFEMILPPLKSAFKLFQACHNSPLTSPNSPCKTHPKYPQVCPQNHPLQNPQFIPFLSTWNPQICPNSAFNSILTLPKFKEQDN